MTPPIPNPAATQLAHATRVMALNPDFRFVPGLGWYQWDGQKWVPEAEGELMAVVHRAADRYARLSPGPFASELSSRRGLEDVSIICRDIPGTRIRASDLDQHVGRLHAAGQTWDLRTGQARATEQSELNTRSLAFDPAAECPTWTAFLASCFPGEPDMPAYLQRLIGYGLTGEATAQIFVLMHGIGGNGKSVFIDALTHAFSPYTCHLPVQVLMAASATGNGEQASPQLMRLRGARLVFTSESDREGRLDEAKVKLLTGGDPISVRGLYQAAVTFKPEALIMMATNHLPEIRGTDKGIWRRVKVIEWRECFEGDRRDKTLAARLRTEAAGIVNWAIEGAIDWYARGDLDEPERVATAIQSYKDDSDFLGSFVPGWIEPDPTGWMARSEIIDLWDNFTIEDCRTPLRNNNTLFSALRERGFTEAMKTGGRRGFKARRAAR